MDATTTTGTTHWTANGQKTLCGKVITKTWTIGHQTPSEFANSRRVCVVCRRLVKKQLAADN